MELSKISIESESIFELTGLHRILHKSKFEDEQHDLYTPYGSAWSNKVLNSIMEYYRLYDKNRYLSWQEWRRLDKNRREYPVIIKRLSKAKSYYFSDTENLTDEQKIYLIGLCTSPFVLNDEMLEEFKCLI